MGRETDCGDDEGEVLSSLVWIPYLLMYIRLESYIPEPVVLEPSGDHISPFFAGHESEYSWKISYIPLEKM